MYKASALAVLAVVSLLSPIHAQSTTPGDTWQQWLRDVDLLIAPKEREAFLALPGDAERRAFAERFWQVRDPFPETPRNELQERWSSGLAEARSRWGTLDDDRSRVFLLQGEPSSGFMARCEGIAGELELWAYEPRFRVKHRSLVVFERPAQGPARIWRPADGVLPVSAQCTGGEKLGAELQWLKMVGAEHYRGSVERALLRPKPRQADWYESLVAFSPAAPAVPAALADSGVTAAAASFDAGLQVDYPGQVEERRVVRVMMTVPPGSLRPPAAAPGGGAQDLVLTGQVLRDREVLESFRYRFRVHPEAVEGQGIPLAFERYLLPGFYHLRIKLENLLSKSSFQGERELAVPGPQGSGKVARAALPASAAPPAPSAAPGDVPGIADVAGLYSEAAAALGEREPGVHIFGPADNLLIGNVRFEARIDEQPDLPEAERVDRVAFVLDGRRVLTRNRPPYAVTLDLGPVPRSRTLRVEGLSRDDRVLAVDEMALNAGAQRFAVQLVEPRPDRAYRRSLRARAEIEPPAGQTVERVEFYFNEDLVATLYQPPYSQPIALPGRDATAGYVRAVAYLADGLSSEDVVILNTPESPDAMDVRLVELYTAVMDEAGRPVEGLAGGDFQVAEDGVRQTLRRVERVTDIPVRVVELIDNSGSMRGRMEDTRKAALGFLRRTLRPVDQAAVITFNQAPQVAVGFTNEMAALEEGFTGLVAEDYTSLYDSIAFALHYLTGVKGQRAILLLSDGEDRSSHFGYEQILEYARRSGITLYAIGLDLPEGRRGEAAKKLERLAAETGGRSFFLSGTGELDAVYQEIERDLRSQYRITYQSSNTSTEDTFRAIDVQVKAGRDARTISGYYP